MYPTEETMFEYFIKEDRELSFEDFDKYFTAGDFMDVLDVITILTRQNLITQISNQVWKITDIGKNEYLRRQLDKRTKLREDWYKRNWLLADAIKYLIGAGLGAAITAATLLTCNPKTHPKNIQPDPSQFQDTLNKK